MSEYMSDRKPERIAEHRPSRLPEAKVSDRTPDTTVRRRKRRGELSISFRTGLIGQNPRFFPKLVPFL